MEEILKLLPGPHSETKRVIYSIFFLMFNFSILTNVQELLLYLLSG